MTRATSQPAGPVPSPCVDVCRMEPASGVCEGCLRTLDEIGAWSQLSEEAKLTVWQQLAVRRAARQGHGTHRVPAAEGAEASSKNAP